MPGVCSRSGLCCLGMTLKGGGQRFVRERALQFGYWGALMPQYGCKRGWSRILDIYVILIIVACPLAFSLSRALSLLADSLHRDGTNCLVSQAKPGPGKAHMQDSVEYVYTSLKSLYRQAHSVRTLHAFEAAPT